MNKCVRKTCSIKKTFFVISLALCGNLLFAETSFESKNTKAANDKTEVLQQEIQKTNIDDKETLQIEPNARERSIEEMLSPNISLQYSYGEKGVEVSFSKKIKDATVYFRQYDETANAHSFGILNDNEKVYCPYGSTMCFWLEYDNGIKSRARVFYAWRKNTESETLLQLHSPQAGTWKREQVLHIDAAANTTVYYSLDGSDPEKFGQIYYTPFTIEKNGTVSLRIKAVCADGRSEEKKVSYSVSRRYGAENDADFYFFNSIAEHNKTVAEKRTPYNILAWNYLEFLFQTPVAYEISTSDHDISDNTALYKTYSAPIFLDRTEDLYLFWSCKSFENGTVQKIFLPAKPKLFFSEESTYTQNPVTISFSDKRYRYSFVCGDIFIPQSPEISDYQFDGTKKTFALGENKKQHYSVRIKAFYEGVAHGEFFCNFTISRERPPQLIPVFSSDEKITNKAVTIKIPSLPSASDYTAIVKITPEAKQLDRETYLLEGKNSETTDYRVVAYYEDAAHNRGEIFQRAITVAPAAIYVDSSKTSGDGSARKPFNNLESAFELIKQKKEKAALQKLWTIYAKGTFTVNEAIFVSDKIKLCGDKTKLILKTNVGFVLENAEMNIENIILTREEHPDEPRNVPIIYASNTTLNIIDCSFETKNDSTAIRLCNTKGFFQNIQFSSEQKKYTESFVCSNSELIIQNLQFYLKCGAAVAMVFDNCTTLLSNCNLSVEPQTVARIFEIKNSRISFEHVTAARLPDSYNTDTCIVADKNSTLKNTENVDIQGFKYELR